MSTTIEQYREAKAAYEKLQNQAKKDLIARFNQLATELLQIQKELRDDFGHKVTIPSKPKGGASARTTAAKEAQPVAANPKVTAIEKRLAAEKKKLQDAVAAGKPEKAIKDRIYELEDALRLAQEA